MFLKCICLLDFDRMGDIVEDQASFYSNAEDYWKEVAPTVDGMLGGYGSISSIDINGSKAFLKKFLGVRRSCSLEPFCVPDPVQPSAFDIFCRKAKGRRGQAALWIVERESAGSPSGCCCLCSGPWTWWTSPRSSWIKPGPTWGTTGRGWGTTSAVVCRSLCRRRGGMTSSGSSGSSVSRGKLDPLSCFSSDPISVSTFHFKHELYYNKSRNTGGKHLTF